MAEFLLLRVQISTDIFQFITTSNLRTAVVSGAISTSPRSLKSTESAPILWMPPVLAGGGGPDPWTPVPGDRWSHCHILGTRSGHSPGHIPRTFSPPGQIDKFPFLFAWYRTSLTSTTTTIRWSTYNMKRSTVNVYKVDKVDRLGSGVRISASFQIFALTRRENVLGGEENCPRGGTVWGICAKGGKCPRLR